MFDEPDEPQHDRPFDPADRAREKFDEFRMHAEMAAVLEGHRKFDAQLLSRLEPEVARDLQRSIAKLEKSKSADSPVLPESSAAEALRLLTLPGSRALTTNDYHVHRRPGEVMIARWLEGDEVDSFYERLQAHFDAALNQFREEERQANEWKQDPPTLKYLEALDAIDVRMADRYLREPIRQSAKLTNNAASLYVLSTQTADEIDIIHLTDYVMGVPTTELVGPASAPPDEAPTERDRAWFFKLFSLRGMSEAVERMCFFVYLQKADAEEF